MKKLFIILLCLLVSGTIEAQRKQKEKTKAKKVEQKGMKVVGLYAGISATGVAYEVLEQDSDTLKYTTSVKPAFQATFDYFFTNKVTFGFFSSIQPFRVDISHWEYDTLNPKSIDDLQAKITRIYVGGKILYHFKNTEKVDIYTGIRGGVLFWNKKLPSTEPAFVNSFTSEFPMINRPSIGIVPIGFRIKFTPQIAVNVELNASAPHLFAFGGSYAF